MPRMHNMRDGESPLQALQYELLAKIGDLWCHAPCFPTIKY